MILVLLFHSFSFEANTLEVRKVIWVELEMYSTVVIVVLCISATVAPPTPQCFVQTALFHAEAKKTACGGGAGTAPSLIKLSDVKAESVPVHQLFGAENLADLILSRGGIFNGMQRNLETMYVCPLHKRALGEGWTEDESNRPIKKHGSKRSERCNVPRGIEGFIDHIKLVFAHRGAYVSKDQSEAILNQKHKFVPLGTGNGI